MTATAAGTFLILFLPFLLSLAGRATMPKMLCLVASLHALLLIVRPYGAVLPWVIRRGCRIRALSPLPRRLVLV